MAKVPLGLRLEQALIDQVDATRGDVPRAKWIERAIEVRLGATIGKPPAKVAASQAKIDWRDYS
jgi:hypothetical protein